MTQDRTSDRIVDAARELFMENGLRGTSMEAIARAANVAKPTLYGRFKSKDEVFEAVVAQVIDILGAAIREGTTCDGDLPDRVAGGLLAKYAVLNRLLGDSPHARELIEAPKRDTSDAFARFEAELLGRLSDEIAVEFPDEAERFARLAISCADGINRLGEGRADIEADIRFMVQRLLKA
jgi:AcrR family transcriptional regulator